jgi:hypothetical protein
MGRRTTLIVLAWVLLPSAAHCQWLGVRAGIVSPENSDMTFTYGGLGTYRITRYMELEVGMDYWSKTKEETYDSYLGVHLESSASDLSLCAYTKYLVPLKQEEVNLGIGAGFGAHFTNTRFLRTESGHVVDDEKESTTRPGMHFFLEGGAPLIPTIRISTRLKFGWVEDDFRVDLTTGFAFRL